MECLRLEINFLVIFGVLTWLEPDVTTNPHGHILRPGAWQIPAATTPRWRGGGLDCVGGGWWRPGMAQHGSTAQPSSVRSSFDQKWGQDQQHDIVQTFSDKNSVLEKFDWLPECWFCWIHPDKKKVHRFRNPANSSPACLAADLRFFGSLFHVHFPSLGWTWRFFVVEHGWTNQILVQILLHPPGIDPNAPGSLERQISGAIGADARTSNSAEPLG